jgi:hypothetical protein
MRYYRRKDVSTESICIDKITKGINSIRRGLRTGDEIGKDLEFFFNKLEESNKEMYEEMYIQYCTARIESEEKIKPIHS